MAVAGRVQNVGLCVYDPVAEQWNLLETGSSGPGVNIEPSRVTLTDGSGLITTGGASEQIFAANPDRKYFLFQNISSVNQFINFGIDAVTGQPSLRIPPGLGFVMEDIAVSVETINVVCVQTGAPFVAKEA